MMRVREIERMLKHFGEQLQDLGANELAGEVQEFCVSLRYVKDLNAAELGDFLRSFRSDDPSRPSKKPRTVNDESVQMILQEAFEVFAKAEDADALTFDEIREYVKRWDKALNKEEGLSVARAFLGDDQTYPSKISALEAVGRKIIDRLAAQRRIRSLAPPIASDVAPTSTQAM